MLVDEQYKTEYKERIQIDYGKVKIHNEDDEFYLYNFFWNDREFESLRVWPKIKIIRDSPNINDYFKMELIWNELPHSQVTININDDVQYTFNQEYIGYEFLSIDSSEDKINMSDLKKVNIGLYVAFDSGEVMVNRTQEINMMSLKNTNNHSIINNESLVFKSLNEMTILNHDPNDRTNNLKYNEITLNFNILKTQGFWTKIADVTIKNDDSEKALYQNQINDITLTNLIFGDSTKNLILRLSDGLDTKKEILVDEVTTYDYKRKNTFKQPSMEGRKGYVIPYGLKGDFLPILTISINGFFKDFQITIPHHFDNAFLDENNGNVSLQVNEEDSQFDSEKEKSELLINEDNFDQIIKEDLTMEGIFNLAD